LLLQSIQNSQSFCLFPLRIFPPAFEVRVHLPGKKQDIMGRSIFEKIQARIELFRLEQRYTRRRHRRSTFQTNAIYIDGEYIYQTPSSTGSSTSSGPRINALHEAEPMPPMEEEEQEQEQSDAAAEKSRKKMNRFSAMPGFGSSGPKPTPGQDWRPERASFDGAAR